MIYDITYHKDREYYAGEVRMQKSRNITAKTLPVHPARAIR
jgi:hypothetical protein